LNKIDPLGFETSEPSVLGYLSGGVIAAATRFIPAFTCQIAFYFFCAVRSTVSSKCYVACEQAGRDCDYSENIVHRFSFDLLFIRGKLVRLYKIQVRQNGL
tara:strand:+ start:127 stop:429 length:303 start_codon:yes stop_codon:yes gene_type:complete